MKKFAGKPAASPLSAKLFCRVVAGAYWICEVWIQRSEAGSVGELARRIEPWIAGTAGRDTAEVSKQNRERLRT